MEKKFTKQSGKRRVKQNTIIKMTIIILKTMIIRTLHEPQSKRHKKKKL